MKNKVRLGALLSILSAMGYAQQNVEEKQKPEQLKEVIVSDSKFELSEEESGKVVTKITKEILEKSAGMSVSEVLTNYAGIQINESTGQAGSIQGVFVRGSRQKQTIVRINGVVVSSPIAGSNEYDFRFLNLDQIEEIEILKGGNSALYGSGASAAVINIKLKESSKKTVSGSFNVTTGTNSNEEDQEIGFDDNNFSGNVNGTFGKFNYTVMGNYQSTKGISAAEPFTNDEVFEEDEFDKIGLYTNLGYKFTDNIKYNLYVNYDKYETDFDGGSAFDADNQLSNEQTRIGNVVKIGITDKIEFNYNDGFSWSYRNVESDFPGKFTGRNYTFDAFVSYENENGIKTALGANGSYSSINVSRVPFGETAITELVDNDDANFDIIDPYFNIVYNSDFGLNFNGGTRVNIHSVYDTHIVYLLNPSYSYKVGGDSFIQVFGSIGNSYITPSLSELFDNSFFSNNPNLEPETNRTYEGGFKFNKEDVFNINATYFYREHENFIGFDPETFVNINVEDEFKVSGIELAAQVNLLEERALKLNANYTYTNINDLPNNVRIAENVINFSANYQLVENTDFLLTYQYRGGREDTFFAPDFSTETVDLDAYNLIGFQVNQQFGDHINVFGRVSNILNEDYQEVFGFETKGRNFKLGLNFKF